MRVGALLTVILALLAASMAKAKDGDGSATISFNGNSGREIPVTCGAVGTWQVIYTVPDCGMAVGGGIRVFRIPNKYWLGQCKQTNDPKALDYVTAKRSDNGPIELQVGSYYKDHSEAKVRIRDTPMKAGSTITITFGDRSGGSLGAIVPFSWQSPALFDIDSDTDGDGKELPIAKQLVVRPVAGPAAKFVVDVPLVCRTGEKTTLRIRAEDKSSNVVESYSGKITLSCTDPKAKLPKSISLTPRDKGVKALSLVFGSEGIHYVQAMSGKAYGSSNPTKVTIAEPEYRIYRGDLHCHTEVSDGTGSLDFNYHYGRDVSWLDFMGVTDHVVWDSKGQAEQSTDGPFHVSFPEWNKLQGATAARYYSPGKFVTFLAYEWSGGSDVGGDHNVYYLDDKTRVTADSSLDKEYEDLRARGNTNVFVIPHVGGRVADPKWHDPVVEPSVEITSMHGHFEWQGQAYLQKGYTVGFNGSSDGHFGLPGNDTWSNHGRLGFERRDTSVPQGITCAFARELTRDAIREAIYARHTYATTNVKILLDVTMDGHMMGDEYSSSSAPTMHISVAGTGDVGRIEVIRNKERILNRSVSGKTVSVDFRDEEPVQGTSYYYVRVSQNDGEIAWSSPIFFVYTGKPVEPKRAAVAWNYESEEDELGDIPDRDYMPELQKHLQWLAPGRFYDLKQVRLVHSPRGDYVLFYGMDKKNARIHIRWYLGFDSERIHAAVGWRDFGSVRD